jgi:hypothetical protein
MITQEEIKSALKYDQDTGIFYFLVDSHKRKINQPASRKHSKGYVYLYVLGKCILAHRAAWIYVYGKIEDSMQIDHINRNRSDNRISNLRLVSQSENIHNSSIRKTNTSGFVGVGKNCHSKKWRSRITHNGKDIHLGYFFTKEEAMLARKNYMKTNSIYNHEE